MGDLPSLPTIALLGQLAKGLPSVPVQGPVRDAIGLLSKLGIENQTSVFPYHKDAVYPNPMQNGYVDPLDRTRMNINTASPIYKKADKGDHAALRHLASLLAHENVHAAGASNEDLAYDTQMDVLRQLMAPESEIADVRRAKDFVANRGK